MFLATSSKRRQLLCLSYSGRVTVEQLEQGREEVTELVGELGRGFRMLADLGQLEALDMGCVKQIGEVMELLDQKGVSLVVRVIPDSTKDIGLNILSLFHYHHRPRIVTCKDLAEAGEILRQSHAR